MKDREADLAQSRIQMKAASAGRPQDNFVHTWVPADDMGLGLLEAFSFWLVLEGELQQLHPRTIRAGDTNFHLNMPTGFFS